MGLFRKSPQPKPTPDEPVETGPTEAELAATRERIIEHVAGYGAEELRLELPNYDPDRLNELTRTVMRYADDPELAARVVAAAGTRTRSLGDAGERDTDWVVRFANALPDDEDRPKQAAALIETKVAEMEPTVANVVTVERLIVSMPVDEDGQRLTHVATVATWQTVSPETLLDFTERIVEEETRDHARKVAVKVFTSKNPGATIDDAKRLIAGISDRESGNEEENPAVPDMRIADEAWISAAKHFATHGEIAPAALQRFVAEARTEDVAAEAVRKVAIRYFFNDGRDKLIEFIDCFPATKRPELRALAAQAIYESDENIDQDRSYYRNSKKHWEDRIVAALTPKTELVGLIDAATIRR